MFVSEYGNGQIAWVGAQPLGKALHLGPATAIPSSPAASVHLPTGVISLPDVLRLAITELGVTPQREDWERVLAEGQSAS